VRRIPEEKKSGFGKIFGMFKGKEKTEPLPETNVIPVTKEEVKPEEDTKEDIKPEEEATEEAEIEVIEEINEEPVEEKSFEEIKKEQEKKLEESERQKQKQEAKELTEKYGVTKEIPKRDIQQEYVETPKKTKEELDEEIDIPQLLLRLEKIDGKLELFDNSKNETNERITQLAEEIGELRSMIMERERSFTKMETEFENVKETVGGLEPMRIKSAFEKRKMEILENKAKIEELETLVRALNEDVKKFRGLLEKIKSFENIVDMSFDMDRKVAEIRDVKDYADKIAAKVEGIFSELNSKVSQLEGQREKVEKLDELTIEMTKMLDEVSVKLTKFVEEKDLKELRKTIEENFKKTLESKAPVVKIKGNQDIKVFQNNISELSTRISKLKSVVEAQNSVINSIIEYLQGETKEATSVQPEETIETYPEVFDAESGL
jgi:DNA repair exonuclease SbcCD ATPase subunit